MSFGALGLVGGRGRGGAPWALASDVYTDLDFVNNRGFSGASAIGTASSFVSVSRGSTAYIDDLAGNWTSFGNNILRISNKGALIEEARTNSVRNNSMQGAVPGTPGTLPTNWSYGSVSGLTTQVVGIGTEKGIDYIDIRYFGTTAGTTAVIRPEAINQIAVSNGQSWTGSLFVRLSAGSLANVSNINLISFTRDAGNTVEEETFSSADISGSLAGALTRFSISVTLVNALSAFVGQRLTVTFSSGVPVDFTIRIGGPQLELGAFATSPIRTTAGAGTRFADVVTLTTVPTFGSAYTLFGKGTPIAPLASTSNQLLASIDDATANNRLQIRRQNGTGAAHYVIVSGNISQTNADVSGASVWSSNASGKLIFAAQAGAQSAAFNGILDSTPTGALMPVAPTTLHIGSDNSNSNQWDGYVERIALWPSTRLTNAQLQALST